MYCQCVGPCMCGGPLYPGPVGWCDTGYFVKPNLCESSEQVIFPVLPVKRGSHSAAQTLSCIGGQAMPGSADFAQTFSVGMCGSTVVAIELCKSSSGGKNCGCEHDGHGGTRQPARHGATHHDSGDGPVYADGISVLLNTCHISVPGQYRPCSVDITAVVSGYEKSVESDITRSFSGSLRLGPHGPLPADLVQIKFGGCEFAFDNDGLMNTTITLYVKYVF